MATGTYMGVTVHVADDVAAGLPAQFEFDGIETPTQEPQTEVEAEPVVEKPAPQGAPAKTASRGDWAAYAESVGVEPGDMTKAELIAAVSE